MPRILLVEDELQLARRLERALRDHEVICADSTAEAIESLSEELPDLALLDLRLPDGSGLDVLRAIRSLDAALPVVLMTAYSSVEDAVEAMREGATDYLPKPLDLDKMRLLVDTLLQRQRRDRELAYHRARDRALPEGIVTASPAIKKIFGDIDRLREAELPPGRRPAILLTGETGTGKGVLARAIHEQLGGGPFIEINCTAMPATLVESELFGHERGSFTDAKGSRTGLFEAAQGGTLFLDEVGHLTADVQAKFLKAIEEKRIRRIGSTQERAVDTHVIAATNRDLDAAVNGGEFRADLLHRLRVLCFDLPPLRERKEDIALLAARFARELGLLYAGHAVELGPSAVEALHWYPWPGNVRELRNVIERAVLLTRADTLEASAFEALVTSQAEPGGDVPFALPEGGVDLEVLERSLIRQALENAEGNRTRAAALLGLSRHALRYRLEKFELE